MNGGIFNAFASLPDLPDLALDDVVESVGGKVDSVLCP